MTRRVYKPGGWKWKVTMGLVRREIEGERKIKVKESGDVSQFLFPHYTHTNQTYNTLSFRYPNLGTSRATLVLLI